jgi:hypothetical protein
LSDNPQDQDVARAEFLELGTLAEPILREMLNQTTSADHRRLIEEFMDEIREAPQSPETVRELRAVGILERIGSKPAKQLLELLGGGTSAALLTQEARNALKRITAGSVSILP